MSAASSSSSSAGAVPQEEAGWDSDAAVSSLIASAGSKLDPIFEDTATVKRFLRARKGDVPEAVKMLLEHQEWRKVETPNWPSSQIQADLVKPNLASGKAYAHGQDKFGRPLTWVRVKLHDANEPRDQIFSMVKFMIDESLSRVDREGVDQFSIVIDFDGFGYANFDSEVAIFILKTLANNFPERMGKLYFVRESWLFWALWKMISVFVDARTARKIVFLGSSSYIQSLCEDMDISVIPTFLGGKSTYTYDPDHVFSSVGPTSPAWGTSTCAPSAAGATSPIASSPKATTSPSPNPNPNPYISLRDGPRAHLPYAEGSSFKQNKAAAT